jgi:hypothetical protein
MQDQYQQSKTVVISATVAKDQVDVRISNLSYG